MSSIVLPHLEIVDRVKNQFPVLDSVIEFANSRYVALKNYNDISKATFHKAESTLVLVANTVGPVIGRFEQPIHYADNMAVRGLETINQKIDSISRTSEELKTSTVQKIDQTRQRFNSMKNDTIEKVHSVLTVPANVFPLINNIFSAGDYLLDYILPPPEGVKTIPSQDYSEVSLSPDEKISDFSVIIRALLNRMRQFTERLHERLVVYSREKWFPGLMNSVRPSKTTVEPIVAPSPVPEPEKPLTNGHSGNVKVIVQEKKSKKSKSKSVKQENVNELANENSTAPIPVSNGNDESSQQQ